MKSPPRPILLLVCCVVSVIAHTQTKQVLRYTTREGLPSNSIYRTIIDNKGFLWIGTESGVSRYDGRSFRNYFTTDGLPDNEVTELLLDSNGTVWALPFRKKPAYYNERKDRFENSDTDPELQKIEMGNTSVSGLLKSGGVVFCSNEQSISIAQNGKVAAWHNVTVGKKKMQLILEYQPLKFLLLGHDSAYYADKGKVYRTAPFGYEFDWSEYFNESVYILQADRIIRFSLEPDGKLVLRGQQQFPFRLKLMCRAGNDLAITSFTGNTYIVDANTLQLKENIFSQFIVRNVLEDHNGNYWLSTKDEGLIKIQQKRISSYTENKDMLRNFNAILKTDRIIAGNNMGELFSYDGLYTVNKIQLNTTENSSDTWVRNILDLDNSIFVATQTGSFLLNKKTFKTEQSFLGTLNKSSKAAYRLNDSILLMGGHAQLFYYNLRSRTFTDSVLKRVTAIGADDAQQVYIGSIDGLYRKDRDSLYYFGRQYKALSYRIASIVNTKDGLLWIGRSSDSLQVLRNGKPLAAIPLGAGIPGKVCKVLYSQKPGEIWIGTDKGLNRLHYKVTDGSLSYTNLYFSSADGLISDQVNDIVIKNDTVFVATAGGISYLPAHLQLPLADISTFITRVSINNSDTAILGHYSLPFSQNNLQVGFSAVDLTGFNPAFEYRINNREWIRTQENTLSLQNQPPGNYIIQIRSIKRDGTPSTQVATISFHIRTPFWKSGWFRGSLIVFLFVLTLYLLQRRNRLRQKKAIEKITTEKKLAELEMQALKAQINPHFVFNCLNSIKGFIYDQDYAQADQYLDKFSELMRSTIDNSDAAVISLEEEIKYLDNYLQLEKLRFNERFDYSIETIGIDDRKNIFVPAMLLQPYVENAIRHGIRFLEGRKGMIHIAVKQDGGEVVCTIDDNGIGRQKAAALKSSHHVEYQGRGMSISKRRAELYNIIQEITDKKDDAGNAAGTTISLRMPPGLKP